MLNLKIEAAKKIFFDRAAVISAITPAERKVHSKFGAYVRTTAQQSIKPARRRRVSEMGDQERKRFKSLRAIVLWHRGVEIKPDYAASDAGSPPRSVSGLLKKFIFFGLDFATRSVIIGPALLNKGNGAPEVLEYGGQTTVTAGPDRGKRITVAPRPYMRPAFSKILPQLNSMWRNAITN